MEEEGELKERREREGGDGEVRVEEVLPYGNHHLGLAFCHLADHNVLFSGKHA